MDIIHKNGTASIVLFCIELQNDGLAGVGSQGDFNRVERTRERGSRFAGILSIGGQSGERLTVVIRNLYAKIAASRSVGIVKGEHVHPYSGQVKGRRVDQRRARVYGAVVHTDPLAATGRDYTPHILGIEGIVIVLDVGRGGSGVVPALRNVTIAETFKVLRPREDRNGLAQRGEFSHVRRGAFIQRGAVGHHVELVIGVGIQTCQRVGVGGDARHFGIAERASLLPVEGPFGFGVSGGPAQVGLMSAYIFGNKFERFAAGRSFSHGDVIQINIGIALFSKRDSFENDDHILAGVRREVDGLVFGPFTRLPYTCH